MIRWGGSGQGGGLEELDWGAAGMRHCSAVMSESGGQATAFLKRRLNLTLTTRRSVRRRAVCRIYFRRSDRTGVQGPPGCPWRSVRLRDDAARSGLGAL